MCALCKLIVFGYNSLEKKKVGVDDKHSSFSLATLVDALPIGTKSDVANSLLETLETCMLLWRHRFERITFSISLGQTSKSADAVSTAKAYYLKHNKPCFPSAKVLKLLCANLPIEKSVEEVLEKTFGVSGIFEKNL